MVRGLAPVARPCLQALISECRQPSLRLWLGRSLSTTASHSAGHHDTAGAVANATGSIDFAPTTKPPSARPIDTRKSQLIRTYTSLLRTTPLILFFQHSNLTAVEWAAVRRELKKAVESVSQTGSTDLSSRLQLQVVRTNMMDVALRVVEFHNPQESGNLISTRHTVQGAVTHDLSEAAYSAIKTASIPPESAYAQLQPLMVGPLAALILPAVSPAHLSAALSILSPVPGKFPAPSRKKNPGYHEPICQNGLAKLLLVGGRIEGKIFDQSGVNWVGGIDGGLDGLRAQLINTLQGAGIAITSTLQGGSQNLWLTLEGRKDQLGEGSEK